MYRPVKQGKRGRFESLTPDIDREVVDRMDRQSARMTRIGQRLKLIAQLKSDNARDEADNARDREACIKLELRKSRYAEAVKSRKVIPVNFPPQHNKPPKRAA